MSSIAQIQFQEFSIPLLTSTRFNVDSKNLQTHSLYHSQLFCIWYDKLVETMEPISSSWNYLMLISGSFV